MSVKDQERWKQWHDTWNGMKTEEITEWASTDEAELIKVAPEELQLKLVRKYNRLTGNDFPIKLADDTNAAASNDASEANEQPGGGNGDASEKAGLPTQEKGAEEIAKIDMKIRSNMVEGEVARQADLLDAADEKAVEKKLILTEQQQMIAALVDAAEAEAPRIEVTELAQRLMMLIPSVFKESYPEYAYKWASIDNLQSELHTFGGMWEVVARVNHSKIPPKLFGPEGSIIYKGASILVFTRRSITDYLNKQTIQELDLRVRESTQNLNKTYRDPRGREQVHLEIIDKEPSGKIAEVPLKQETFGPGGDYDFPDTGTEQQ